MAKICIDISNIVPGKGGSGGGVVTYAKHMAEIFDVMDIKDEIYLLKHKDFDILSTPKKLIIKNIDVNTKSIFIRILFVQFYLPFFCWKNGINLLYRVTPELPIIKVCKYACTLLDFMFDFYLERPMLKRYIGTSFQIKFLIFRWITLHALKTANVVIVLANTLKEESIRKMKNVGGKIFVTHAATDIPSVVKNVISDEGSIIKIGVIAGFYPHKGHFRVLELAKKIIDKGKSNFSIAFRGNPAFPTFQEEIKKYISENKLENNIHFVGYEANATLADIYSSFDIFLLLSEYEGFGLPVLEAQAFEKPVFSADIPILREVLGDSAFYMNVLSGELDVEGFLTAISDSATLINLKNKGKKNLERFSWEKMCDETYQVFRMALNT